MQINKNYGPYSGKKCSQQKLSLKKRRHCNCWKKTLTLLSEIRSRTKRKPYQHTEDKYEKNVSPNTKYQEKDRSHRKTTHGTRNLTEELGGPPETGQGEPVTSKRGQVRSPRLGAENREKERETAVPAWGCVKRTGARVLVLQERRACRKGTCIVLEEVRAETSQMWQKTAT